MDERSGCHNNLHAQRISYSRRESFSIGSFFSKTVKKKKKYIEHPLYEYSFKEEMSKWNSCLAPDKYFEIGVVKIQHYQVTK